MEGESCVTRCIIEELYSSHIQGDQMECTSGVTRSIIDELHSGDMQGDQMDGENGVTRRISDEFLFLRISKEIKVKENSVVLDVSLMNFILRIWR